MASQKMSKLINVHFLNHASVCIHFDEVRLLIDPWFEGYAFGGGWGLKFQNPRAWDFAQSASHLWLSHFHQDHFHLPTLEKILQINPEIRVIANDSYNFKFSARLEKIGFKNIIPFRERQPLEIAPSFIIKRFPATGIDNILVIKSPDFTIVNYNDCVLSPLARRLLAKKIGPIDIFLVNFNHAGKLLHAPLPEPRLMKQALCSAFLRNFAPFKPKLVLPFASHHYYRAQESLEQNRSLLGISELSRLDSRICDWSIGDHITLDSTHVGSVLHKAKTKADPLPQTVIVRPTSVSLEMLESSAEKYTKKLSSRWSFLTYFIPPLTIFIADLGVTRTLNPKKGRLLEKPTGRAHISAHSASLNDWWNKQYGSDTFIVGAHFTLFKNGRRTMMLYIITGMLLDNALDFKSLLKMATSIAGLKFLINRREEILGILTSLNVAPEYQNISPSKSATE
jgi:Beta-lactamase superfamily domain